MDDPLPVETKSLELPDNKEQAIKRLESTERKLLKNSEEAAAYDQKMMEMEAMNFASKLTDKEIEEYQGPVHYTSPYCFQLVGIVSWPHPQRLLEKGT